MATHPAVSSEAGLVKLLGCCDDYFNEAVGRDDISADDDIIDNACTMESIVDNVLVEIGDAFKLYKQQQETTANTSILVHERTRFAAPKTENEVYVLHFYRFAQSIGCATQSKNSYNALH